MASSSNDKITNHVCVVGSLAELGRSQFGQNVSSRRGQVDFHATSVNHSLKMPISIAEDREGLSQRP
jgi:hypothetical protein